MHAHRENDSCSLSNQTEHVYFYNFPSGSDSKNKFQLIKKNTWKFVNNNHMFPSI